MFFVYYFACLEKRIAIILKESQKRHFYSQVSFSLITLNRWILLFFLLLMEVGPVHNKQRDDVHLLHVWHRFHLLTNFL